MKLKAIIVDDEELARKGLAMRLANFDDIEVVQEAKNAKQAIEAISTREVDIVFLDIQMPGMTGLEMLSKIQADIMPLVIFVTAYDAYAVEAFEVHAIDYLLKPVEIDRLSEALTKAREYKNSESAVHEKQRLMDLAVSLTGKSESEIGGLIEENEDSLRKLDKLAIKDGSTITFVPVHDISWIDAAGDYMCVHADGETHIMRTTMKELESKLNPSIFQRVHRSTIVNIERIEKVSSHMNGEYYLTLNCGSTLKMSRSYKDKVKRFFSLEKL